MAERIIRRAEVYDLAAPGADTDIITALAPRRGGSRFRVTVALTTGSVLNISATDGSTAHAWGLNDDVALKAGVAYEFEHAVDLSNAIVYSYQVETDGVIEMLIVDEVVPE